LSSLFGVTYVFDASIALNLLTFVGMLVWFDLWFYSYHRLFHTQTFYRWHRHHHRSVVTTPFSAHSFSIVERLVLNIGIMLPVLVVNQWTPMPAQGQIAYLYTILVLNTYGHCNVELLPKALVQSWPLKYISTPTSHSLHHIHQNGNFGLVFVLSDRFLGTEIRRSPMEALRPNELVEKIVTEQGPEQEKLPTASVRS
jgi:sterol desaturase/sphingolipid hydroxylase (fatty acid hydroxylase superfamily)